MHEIKTMLIDRNEIQSVISRRICSAYVKIASLPSPVLQLHVVSYVSHFHVAYGTGNLHVCTLPYWEFAHGSNLRPTCQHVSHPVNPNILGAGQTSLVDAHTLHSNAMQCCYAHDTAGWHISGRHSRLLVLVRGKTKLSIHKSRIF